MPIPLRCLPPLVLSVALLVSSPLARAQSDAGAAADAASAPAAPPVSAGAAAAARLDTCDVAGVSLQDVDSTCLSRRAPATDQVPDVASLKAPESPAFMAVGTVPSQIQRPTTPMGVAAALATGVANGGASFLPRNFAMEVAPYWLAKHPDVTFRAWQDQRGRAWYRNASLSLATAAEERKVSDESGETETVNLTNAAAGLRTSLWPGKPSSGAIRCREFLEQYAEQRAVLASKEIGQKLAAWDAENKKPVLNASAMPAPEDFLSEDGQLDGESFNAALRAWQTQLNDPAYQAKKLAELVAWQEAREQVAAQLIAEFEKERPVDTEALEQCLAAIHATQGFAADLAGAYAVRLPDADWSKLDEDGASIGTVWLTVGYIAENLRGAQPEKSAIEGSVLGVFRAQRENAYAAGVARDYVRLDAGLRLVLAARRIGAAIEGTLRRQQLSSAGADTDALLYRAALSLDYRLSGGLWFTGTFGKDFGLTEKQQPLIALANFQWAFDTTRAVSTDRFKTIGMGK